MTKLLNKPVADHRQRSTKRNKPLRSFKELAETIGISIQQLAPMMRDTDTPKPAFIVQHSSGKVTRYYEPIAFMKWYKERK